MRRKHNETAPRITALYERLSREDSGAGDSISIQNQKIKLESYAAEHGFTNAVHYTDDGYSGASFQRPAWNQLMEDIKARKVGTVIVKDMSRVGRNYLEVGYFTEVIFPQYGVRFIAIDSAVDSADQTSTEYAPIMNLVNEWFVKDFSERMKAAWKAKRIAGEHTCTVCMYGYRKDPETPNRWLIDEEAAQVVRHIFQLALEGKGPGEIARILHDKQVEKPSYYRAKRQPSFQLPERPYDWDSSVVSTMLKSREYIGMTVNHKTIRPTYKSRSKIEKLDRSEWQFVEGTQEPIVSETIFYAVQEKLRPRTARKTIEGTNPLKGLVYCADCGAPMANKRQSPQPKKDKNGHPTGKYTKYQDGFECRTYTLGKKHRETACSRHYVNSETLRTLVLETLKECGKCALSDESALLKRLGSIGQSPNEKKEQQKRLNLLRRRSAELDDLIQRTFEDNFRGTLSNEKLSELVEGYETEQESAEREIAALTAQLQRDEVTKPNVQRFLERLRRYASFETLTAEMVTELLEKIVVHERIGSRNNYEQEIEIYFRFIGKVGETG